MISRFMKRALLSQMIREWRTNIWLIVELALVTLAVWAILSVLWFQCRGLFQHLGFNPEGVYSLTVQSVSKASPRYLKEYKDSYYEDRNELIRRLRRNPNVEYVSLENNFSPYELNYSGDFLIIDGYPDSISYYGNSRTAESDIIKLMDIKSLTGKSSEELTAILERGEILISPNGPFEESGVSVEDLIGKKAHTYDNEDETLIIGDVVERVKRSNYEYDEKGVIIKPFGNNPKRWGNIILKVKPGKDKQFEQDFKRDKSLSHFRNVYFSELKSLKSKGENLHRETEINIRVMIGISFFLFVTIFLGLLGSFWFRVQQRVSEIAVRKTFGATDKDLFRRIIGEGMILLLAGLFLASACVWPFIRKITESTGEKWWLFLAIEGITSAAMAIGVIVSLWYPAWRGMRIEPAIAVKEE